MSIDRTTMIQNLYQYSDSYTLDNPLYKTSVIAFMNEMLGEDLRESGCITALAIFDRKDKGRAMISAKQKGILAGLEETCLLLDNFRTHLQYELAIRNGVAIKDGDELQADEDPILFIEGDIITILEVERTILNILQRMSGIASEVHYQQERIYACQSHSRLAATRKLQWARLDKKAFIIGGGLSHRRGLYDTMMIKDTEIDFWHHIEEVHAKVRKENARIRWISESIERCWSHRDKSKGLIVEVETREEAAKVARQLKDLQNGRYYPCAIMLDNFKPKDIITTLDQCRGEGTYEWTLFESSGNITEETIEEYAKTGVDVLSTGKPTHSTNVLDIHMKVVI